MGSKMLLLGGKKNIHKGWEKIKNKQVSKFREVQERETHLRRSFERDKGISTRFQDQRRIRLLLVEK